MALINCIKHGIQGAELVSRNLRDVIANKERNTGKILDICLKFEDIEFPRFITYDDLKEMALEDRISDGIVEFNNEKDLEDAIGQFVPVCLKCLQEVMQKK